MNCKNCKQQLSEGTDYCNNCGAKVIRNRLTVRSLFQDFSEQFLNYDNRFLQTIITLFRKPEVVIGGYIYGTRKKYANVLSYFAIAVTYTGFFTYINQKYFPDSYNRLFAGFSNSSNQAEISSEIISVGFEYQAFIFFLTIPLLAMMSRLVFLKNKKYNYTEHLVINMYAYSQISIAITTFSFFTQFDQDIFYYNSMIGLPLQILFFAYVLKRMFNLSLRQIILKTLLFMVILIPIYIIFIILVFLYMFLFTDIMQNFIDAEKAKNAISYIVSSAINWTS